MRRQEGGPSVVGSILSKPCTRIDGGCFTILKDFVGHEISTATLELPPPFCQAPQSFTEQRSAIQQTITVSDTTLWNPIINNSVKGVDRTHLRKGHASLTSTNRLLIADLEQDAERDGCQNCGRVPTFGLAGLVSYWFGTNMNHIQLQSQKQEDATSLVGMVANLRQ